MEMQSYEFWFVVGSQSLYGPEVLETVANRAAEMVGALNASGNLPCKLVYKALPACKSRTAILPPSTTVQSPTRRSTWTL